MDLTYGFQLMDLTYGLKLMDLTYGLKLMDSNLFAVLMSKTYILNLCAICIPLGTRWNSICQAKTAVVAGYDFFKIFMFMNWVGIVGRDCNNN